MDLAGKSLMTCAVTPGSGSIVCHENVGIAEACLPAEPQGLHRSGWAPRGRHTWKPKNVFTPLLQLYAALQFLTETPGF